MRHGASLLCDFGEFLHRSLCVAAASIAVGDDGLDRIWIRLARLRSSTAVASGDIAARGGLRAGLVPAACMRRRASATRGLHLTTTTVGADRAGAGAATLRESHARLIGFAATGASARPKAPKREARPVALVGQVTLGLYAVPARRPRISLPDDGAPSKPQGKTAEPGISRSQKFFARAARRYLDDLAEGSLTQQNRRSAGDSRPGRFCGSSGSSKPRSAGCRGTTGDPPRERLVG